MRILGRKQYLCPALGFFRTDCVAIAAVIGAPYIAVRRAIGMRGMGNRTKSLRRRLRARRPAATMASVRLKLENEA